MEKLEIGLKRLETELSYAEKLLKLLPDAECAREIRVVRSLFTGQARKVSAETVDVFVADCEKRLAKTAVLARSVTVHCVAHAHIDMNWMWPFDETVAVVRDTFATMLKLMERYPKFTYSQSQASVYKILEEYDPGMLKTVGKRVKEGRWEVPSATWVEADKNMASGESQVRQLLYTKRYFKKIFGLGYDATSMDFEPDTFGHPAQTPAILSRGGVKFYYHCRGFDGPKLYRWQAADGSSIIAYLEKESWYIKHSTQVEPAGIGDFAVTTLKQTGLRDALFVYGVGDHGGGPTVREVENILLAASWPVFPTVRFSTYASYFKAIEPHAEQFPVVTGEHNFIFTGCYTSQSEIKKSNRAGDRHLLEAEGYSAVAAALKTKAGYPSGMLERAWESHLFNQFHDILPGSGRRETREYALGKFQEIMAAASSARKNALASIGGLINTEAVMKKAGIPSHPAHDRALGAGVGFGQDKGLSSPGVEDASHRIFVVFNPLPYTRTGLVETVLWDMPGRGGITVKAADGKPVPCQMLEYEGAFWAHVYKKIVFEAADVPPFGYKTYVVYEDPALPADAPVYVQPEARLEAPVALSFENEFLAVELDTCSGALKSLRMKETGLELAVPGAPAGLFRIIDESPVYHGGMTSWLVGNYARIQNIDGAHFSKTKIMKGPLRQGAVWTANVRNSKLTIGVYLEKGSPAIRFECACDWLEWGTKETFIPQLNVVFPLPLSASTRTFEVPFGAVCRDTENQDVPALRWADISGLVAGTKTSAGLTVFTDSKYGFRAGKDFMAVSLLRSSFDPDPYPELGEHAFSLTVFPHAGMCNKSAAFRSALDCEYPLTAFQVGTHPGTLPLSLSFLEITDKNVVLSAVKKPERGRGLIVRFYEVEGKDTEVRIRAAKELFSGIFTVTETDLLERPTGKKVVSKAGRFTWKIPAYGILTLLLE